jgi:hypothetical protein
MAFDERPSDTALFDLMWRRHNRTIVKHNELAAVRTFQLTPGNDVGLLQIAAMCIEDVFSSGVMGCHRECWSMQVKMSVWVQFESRHSVEMSLVEAICLDWNAVLCVKNSWRF